MPSSMPQPMLAMGMREPSATPEPVATMPEGRLAQLVERLPYKQEVACSSQAPPIVEVPATGLGPERGEGAHASGEDPTGNE